MWTGKLTLRAYIAADLFIRRFSAVKGGDTERVGSLIDESAALLELRHPEVRASALIKMLNVVGCSWKTLCYTRQRALGILKLFSC